MRNKILLGVFGIAAMAVLMGNSNGYNSNRTGANSTTTGCGGGCHGSTTSIGTVIEMDSAGTPVTVYHPGVAYTVKISATNNTTTTNLSKYGFQLCAVKITGAGTSSATQGGTWGTLPAGTQQNGGTLKYIQHNQVLSPVSGTGGVGTVYTISIPWTAPAAGTGSVKFYGLINAVNNNGNDDSGDKYQLANAITVTEYVAPVTASVSISETSGTNPTCQGSSVTFTATPTNGGTAPTYQWMDGATAIGTGTTLTTSSLSAGTHSITCVMTSNLSGVTGNPATSNAISLVVNAPTVDSVHIAATATSFCAGTSVTFTATPYNGGTSPTYQWKDGTTNIGTGATLTTSTLTAGSHTITCVMTPSGTCVSPATSTSNAITVTVSTPTIDSVSVSATATTVCAGSSVTFTATPHNGGTTPAYQWKDGTTNIGTGATLTTSSLTAGTHNITCVMTPSGTCVSPSTSTSRTIVVTVSASVAPTITLSGTSTVCTGSPDTIRAAITNGGTNPSYSWTVNSGAAGTNSPTLVIPSISANSSVVCTLTSNASCVSPASVASSAFTITVSGAVTPTISISTAHDTVCAGSTAAFTAVSTGGGATPSYQWLVGSTPGGTNSSSFSSATLADGSVVTCVLTSSLGCATQQHVTSNGITMTVGPMPSPGITPSGNVHVCAGDSVLLTASGGSTYTWSNGATGATTYAGQSAGYSVTATSSLGCSAALAGGVVVSVSSPAVPTITQSGSILTSTPAAHYQWVFNNTPMPADTMQSVLASANGNYVVVVSDADGCFTPSAAYNVTGVGIQDVNAMNNIRLYPVPNHGSFAVDMQYYSGTTLAIYDIYGKEVYRRDITAAHTEVADADLSPALYFVLVQSAASRYTVKMQVVK